MRAAFLLLLLGGCTLIDQRTFAGAAVAPDPASIARSAALPPLPFLRIRIDGQADFQASLQAAVDAAQSRKRNVEFDVLAPLPTTATREVQDIYAANGAADTAAVASGLGYAGVDEDRIHVGYRNDAGAPAREVLVFVR